MTFVTTFLVLSIVGTVNAGYLAYRHYRRKPLVCPLDHDCSVVTESRWASIFGVRNEVLGLIFYAGNVLAMVAALSAPSLSSQLYFLLAAADAAGFLFSLFLVYLQIFVIKDYCFYCIISAFLALLLFINAFALFRSLS